MEEWGLTIDATERKIVNRSKRDLDVENLNLYHEDAVHVCVSTLKVMIILDIKKLKYHINEQGQKQNNILKMT